MRRSIICYIAGCLTVFSAGAQTPAGAQSPEELRRQLDELRAQMAAQTKRINAIQAQLDEQGNEKAVARPQPSPSADAGQQSNVPPAVPTQQVSEATSNYQTFSLDSEAAARINNAPLDPKYPGFFRLPGTDTFL